MIRVIFKFTYHTCCHSNYPYSFHICLLGDVRYSDIWWLSRWVHRWRHLNRIRVPLHIYYNLENNKPDNDKENTQIQIATPAVPTHQMANSEAKSVVTVNQQSNPSMPILPHMFFPNSNVTISYNFHSK